MSRYEDPIRAAVYSLTGVVMLLLPAMLASCKTTRYVSVPEYHKEYVNRTDTFLRSDTVFRLDSVVIRQQGDTTVIERIRWQNRFVNVYKVKTDTIMKSDSIRVPYPVERRLTKWEKFKMDVGGWAVGIASAALFALVVYVVMWIVRTRRKV